MFATLVNRTSHVTDLTVVRDGTSRWLATAVVKASYTWEPSGEVVPAATDPILSADVYAGDPGTSGLLQAAEMGPPKPRVDVLLSGALVFPGPVESVDVGLVVGTRLAKAARVFGDRRWQYTLTGQMAPGRTRPTGRMPICWERVFGGVAPDDPRVFAADNPAGCGLSVAGQSLDGHLAPNFEDPLAPITTSKDRPAPRGFGPVAPHWSSRRRHAGTFDEVWARRRKPLGPPDFDPRYFNVAPEDQQLEDYRAGEEVRLVNMTSAGRERFRLPALDPVVTFATADELFEDRAVVDTVTIEPETRRLTLIARAAAPLVPDPMVLRRVVVGELTRGWRVAFEKGKQYLPLRELRP